MAYRLVGDSLSTALALPFTVVGAVQWIWHIALVVAGFLRFSIFGGLYLVVYFVNSLVSVHLQVRIRKLLLWITLPLSLIATLLQVALQITWAFSDDVLPVGSTGYIILSVFGIQRFDNAGSAFRIITPDPLVLSVSIALWFFLYRKKANANDANPENKATTQPSVQGIDRDAPPQTPTTIAIDESVDNERPNALRAKRRERRFWLQTAEFTLILAAIALGFSFLTAPSVLSLPYVVSLLLALWLWTTQTQISKRLQDNVHNFLMIFALLHLVLVYLYQLEPLQTIFPSSAAEWLGLYAYYSTGEAWQAPIWPTYMLMPSLLIVVICIRGFERCISSADAVYTRQRPSSTTRSVLWAPHIYSPKSLFLYLFMLAPPILMAWSLTFPSYITLVFLIWSIVAVLYPTSRTPLNLFNKPLLLLALAFVLFQTVANFGGLEINDVPEAGWQDFENPFLSIGGQLLFTLGFCFTVYPTYAPFTPPDSRERRRRRFSLAGSETSLIIVDETPEHKEAKVANDKPVDEVAQKRKAEWASFKKTLRVVFGLLTIFFLENLYIVALAVVYFCSLQKVNVINGIFLLFFLLFLLSRAVARRGWFSLVVYTELVLLAQFMWQFPFTDSIPNDNALVVIFGMEDFNGNLWYGLAWHVVILFACWLQLATFEYLTDRKQALVTSLFSFNQAKAGDPESTPLLAETNGANTAIQQDEAEPTTTTEATEAATEAAPANAASLLGSETALPSEKDTKEQPWHVRAFRVFELLYDIVVAFIFEHFIILCFFQFMLIALTGAPNAIEITYLVFFFVCLIAYQLHLPSIVVLMWPFVVFSSATFLTLCYLFQFPPLQEWLFTFASANVWADIGLVSNPPPRLFLYLLQHVAIFLSTGFQFRLFLTKIEYKSLWGEEGYIANRFPKFVQQLISFVQRFIILAAPRSVLCLLFFSAIQRINLINGVLLILLALYAPLRRAQRWTQLIVLIWTELLLISQLVYQFSFVQSAIPAEDLASLEYVGFIPLPPIGDTSHVSSFYLLREIFLIFMLALSAAGQDWRKSICQETHESMRRNVNGTLEYDPEGTFLLFRSEPEHSDPDTPKKLNQSDIVFKEGSMWNSLKDFISNFVSYSGLQLALLMHVVAALVRLNAIGVFYLICLGFFLVLPRRIISRIWFIHLGVIAALIVWQYGIRLGLPPNAEWDLPWADWSPELQTVLGLNPNETPMRLTADFFLLFFCVLQRDVFYRERAQARNIVADESGSVQTDNTVLVDFTASPRSFLSEIKLVYYRYFFRVVIVLTFIGGTSSITVLSFLYLLFSLYMLSQGEDVLLDKTLRTRIWFVYRWYNYLWFLLVVAYQIPAYLTDLANEDLLNIIGFNRLFLREYELITEYDELSFSKSRIICLLTFATMLIQQSIYDSPNFPLVLRFMEEELKSAAFRQAAYKTKQKEEQERKRAEITDNFAKSKAKYDSMVKKFYSRWSGITFGQGVSTRLEKDKSTPNLSKTDLGPSKQEVVTSKHDKIEAFDVKTDKFPSSSEAIEPVPNVLPPLPDPQDTEDNKDQAPVEHSKWMKRFDAMILWLFTVSADYSVIDDVSTVEEQTLSETSSWNLRWWLLMFGIYYALLARVDLLVYFFIYLNQIINGTILSTVLSWSLLLFGISSHPFTPRTYWTFVIVYIEIVIIVKYFFQFPFEFNALDCSPDAEFQFDPVTILGIQRYCGAFFSPHIVSEMLILVSTFSLRTVLQKFGLWDSSSLELSADEAAAAATLASKNAEVEPSTVKGFDGSINSDSDPPELIDGQEVIEAQAQVPAQTLDMEDIDDVEQDNPVTTAESGFDPVAPFTAAYKSVVKFINSLTDNENTLGEDHYTNMFFADAVVFLLTVLFFNDFSTDSSSDLNYILSQNTVPVLFLAIAITEFILILVDRMIYSAKAIRMKLLMQYGTVIAYHIWLFFFLPGAKGAPFIQNGILPVWYLCKCFYWYFSAKQLKDGYLQFNINLFFLTRSYNLVNRYLYIGYRLIPFIFEIRCLLDWTVADTTLNFFRWLKFEDIYASNYDIKTFREAQKKDNRRVGDIQPKCAQWCLGITLFILLVLLLWFPLLLLALPGATVINPPTFFNLELTINNYDAVFVQSTGSGDISTLTQEQFNELSAEYPSVFSRAVSLINYDELLLKDSSRIVWAISPPARTRLISELTNPNIISTIETNINIDRTSLIYPTASGRFLRQLSRNESEALAGILAGEGSLDLPNLFPTFMESLPSGDVRNLDLSDSVDSKTSVTLTHANGYVNDTGYVYFAEWFEVMQTYPTSQDGLIRIVLLSDNVLSSESIGSYGIIGLYVVVVYTVGSLIRVMISNAVSKIMFEDLPSVDPILEMCHDIYVAREFKGFVMEEELYSELIELYRDPQALIEISKVKDE